MNSTLSYENDKNLSTVNSNNVNNGSEEYEDHFCKKILYVEIGPSRLRAWDLLLLIPVLLFLLGLLLKLNNARLKLRAVHSPIYATFYCLIWLNTIIAFIRCIVSMSVTAATTSGDEANVLLYVTVRFFLLATEMSVVVFAVLFGIRLNPCYFVVSKINLKVLWTIDFRLTDVTWTVLMCHPISSHLDNRTSIRRVLIFTSFVALPYSVVQGSLELLAPDPDFYVDRKDYYLFGHGGSMFWFFSSLLFAMAYSCILVLRLDCLRRRFLFLLWMPIKKSFYVYLGFLVVLNLVQAFGSGLYHAHYDSGLCLVDLTTWIYFSFLTPSIYYTFIYQLFRKRSPDQVENIVFSYKSDDDDTASLPANSGYPNGQAAFSSLTEEDVNGIRIGSSFGGPPMNPLYASSLQSPDSLTGYSVNSVDSINVQAYGTAT